MHHQFQEDWSAPPARAAAAPRSPPVTIRGAGAANHRLRRSREPVHFRRRARRNVRPVRVRGNRASFQLSTHLWIRQHRPRTARRLPTPASRCCRPAAYNSWLRLAVPAFWWSWPWSQPLDPGVSCIERECPSRPGCCSRGTTSGSAVFGCATLAFHSICCSSARTRPLLACSSRSRHSTMRPDPSPARWRTCSSSTPAGRVRIRCALDRR